MGVIKKKKEELNFLNNTIQNIEKINLVKPVFKSETVKDLIYKRYGQDLEGLFYLFYEEINYVE